MHLRDSLEYRALAHGEHDAVIDLYGRVFEVDYDEARWRWQYVDNPLATHEEIFTCWEDTRLAGHTASVPLAYIHDGAPAQASHIQNICVDPRFRRRGIFSQILAKIVAHHDARGTKLLTGHPNASSFPLMMHTGHYEHVLDLYPWALDIRALDIRDLAGASPDANLEVSDALAFSDEDVACFRHVLEPHAVYNARGLAYLNWRFGPGSGRGYQVVRARTGGRLLGLAIVKPYLAGRSVDVVEWAAPPEPELLQAMLVAAVASIPAPPSGPLEQVMTFSMEHLPLHAALLRLGFARVDRPTPFLVRGAAPGSWQRASAWYLSMADSDVY